MWVYLFFTHSGEDSDDEVLALGEGILDLLADFTLRELDIILERTIGGHKTEEVVILGNVELFSERV